MLNQQQTPLLLHHLWTKEAQNDRRGLIIGATILGCMFLYIARFLYTPDSVGLPQSILVSGSIALIGTASLIMAGAAYLEKGIFSYLKWRRLASKELVFAEDQPTPVLPQLVETIEIQGRISLASRLPGLILIIALPIGLPILVIWYIGINASSIFSQSWLFLLLFLFVALMLLFAISPKSLVRYNDSWLEVPANQSSEKTGRILFHHARLFVRYYDSIDHRLYYLLASDTHFVRWRIIEHPEENIQPVELFEVYQQQMKALHSFIVARTGLPLYEIPTHTIQLIRRKRYDHA